MSKLLNEWPVVWRRWNPTTETWSYHAEELKGLTCEPLYTAPPERTLRDHFAGMAMQGLLASPVMGDCALHNSSADWLKDITKCSYDFADFMMVYREKRDDT